MIKILYHKGCLDGLGSAFIADMAYSGAPEFGPVKCIPVDYGDTRLPQLSRDDHVLIVDFSYPRDVLVRLEKDVKSLLVLDHHKTAEENLRGLPFAKFDMDKSGVGLTWEHFYPGVPMPRCFQHIQDRDLWKFEMPATTLITLAM